MSKYIDGLTYEQLGEKYDLTDRQVKNIVYKPKYLIEVFIHLSSFPLYFTKDSR